MANTTNHSFTANWLDREAYPFLPNFVEIDQHQIHYIDEGKGPTILFVHGTPLWSFVYRKLIKELSSNYRCIAFDHLGFGLSDKPKNYTYTAQQHSKNLSAFIQKLKLNQFTLVVHDFGGPIGLNHAIQNPQQIERLVLFNTWMWSNEKDPDFQKMCKIIGFPLIPFLYKYFNFSPKFLIPQAWGSRSKLTKKVHQQYCKPFRNASERLGALGFRNSLLNEQHWFETLWKQRAKIKAIPSLLLWGNEDPFMKLDFMKRFEQLFNNSTSHIFDKVGHLVADEANQEVLSVMHHFLETSAVV